jgi:hypothetical protein
MNIDDSGPTARGAFGRQESKRNMWKEEWITVTSVAVW